jgi:hypothetical protein
MIWRLICKSSDYAFKSARVTTSIITKKKSAFMIFFQIILGFIIAKQGKLPDPKKIQAIINMHVHNLQHIQVSNGMAQIYKCFIKNFTIIMALVTKLTRRIESFLWMNVKKLGSL